MKKIYTPNGEYKAGFPKNDEHGWYKEVDDTEFSQLLESNQIELFNGIYTMNKLSRSTASTDSGIYSNPGAALKGIATVFFVIGVIGSIIAGVVVGKLSWEFNFAAFLGIALGGSLISYVSGLGLAAFGDLVLSANEINRKIGK